MAIDRRQFLIGSVTAVSAARALSPAAAQTTTGPAFVAVAKRGDATHVVLVLGQAGEILRELPLSARGHDIAIHSETGNAVAFARRPGTFAAAFNVRDAREPQIFTAVEGRHFFGHGAFSRDGRLLYVSENDIADARGVIGIYDVAAGFKRTGEMPSYGVGPHEIILLADRRTLAIANGGIDTVPEAGRENLDLGSMAPSLALIDAASGALIACQTLEAGLKQLSIRHLAEDAKGQVWFGGQWAGDLASAPELVGHAGRDNAIKLIEPAQMLGTALKGYIGSMAVTPDGATIAASAPKAGRILYIDAASGAVRAQSSLKDGCGIAGEGPDAFATTSGLGAFRHETAGARVLSEVMLAEIAFDNHLRRLR